ncbi:MAG: bifunctional adenosylcobinamide kinase/adenosylcobinamide-phosphate guanylyltransferase [Hydrogenophaga sp.]|uniref:bifunctional adenosylcobinamide kinase/adenosylcobinamide-phosphate guanylyltransferase n=1 Tax=Hydrogenophaga sp. TaxID=1904254 RepID=UPI00260E1106|nr:bifunctional adenosylcobinamide kinase/adenosylcobinamide-phosphate guanylyltransferase [Hydrogenophaga sp.]MDD3786913.1 bifunctional adenosylcobinamide kinase/adenosylcobinamide-phosphate guanylyltransferase [Hydrogenophaga sp.]
MNPSLSIARSELILGGQKSGKSRRAEGLARDWLAQAPQHRALLIATGQAHDDEMRERIARHRRERAERVPGLATLEEPRELADAIARHGAAHTLIVVDCLTLWLTHWLMPPEEHTRQEQTPPAGWPAPAAPLLEAVRQSPGPVVLVGNEIGLGVIPMGREVRAFVDALGSLNQQVAGVCERVTLMAAGLPLFLKNPS